MTATDLAHGNLGTSTSSLVSATTSTDERQVIHATFYNAHTSAVTVTVYYVRTGETAGDAGTFKGKKKIPPGKTWICIPILGQPIGTLASIQGLADVNNVVHYNIGVEVG